MFLSSRMTIGLATATAALGLLFSGSARAGTYEVRSCDDAAGAQNAWVAWANRSQMTAYSACPSYGDWTRAIVARNGIANSSLVVPQNTGAWQFFTAPTDATVTNVHFSGELFRAAGGRWNVGLSNGSQMLAGVQSDTTYAWDWKTDGADIPVPHSQTVYWETACYGPSGCETQSTGDAATHYVRAAAWIRGTVVTVEDPTTPSASWDGSLLSGQWISGDRSLSYTASDNSGIASVTATLDGRQVLAVAGACDFTRPQPCPGSDQNAATVSTAGWTDGLHPLHLEVRDAAGNPAAVDTQVKIDNTAPARISDLTVDGGEGWRAVNSFTLRWTTPAGEHAPIAARHLRLCPADGGSCQDTTASGDAETLTVSLPRPGTWRAQVWLEDEAGNQTASNASDPVNLRYDNTTPPAAKITAPSGWIGASAAHELTIPLALIGGASAPPSGIAGYSVTTDASDPDAKVDTDASWTLSDLPEGTVTLKARAISGAGLAGPITTTTIKVDTTPPTADASGLPDPGAWQADPVTVQLAGSDERSGPVAIHWQLDDHPAHDDPGDHTSLTISDDGRHSLTWETVDAAGNHSRARQAVIRLDRNAPETAEIQPLDAAHPRTITARVADQGSGIAIAAIQMRPAGGVWTDLDSTLDPQAGTLTTTLDDLHLADGRYELRAVATDRVGNQRAGTPVAITLPLRTPSRLALAPAMGHAHGHGTAARRGLVLCLTNPSGTAIPRATIDVYTKNTVETAWHLEKALATDSHGRADYIIPAGPSRTIRFLFPGNDTIRPAIADHTVTTPARSTIHASRRTARLGQSITFTGRLAGGPIPRDGKVIELQAYDGGRWRSFPNIVRTNARGAWQTTVRFERTHGTYTYNIRARIFHDDSYPYATGTSRAVRVTVHGR